MTIHDLAHIVSTQASFSLQAHRVTELELDGLFLLVTCSDDILAILRRIKMKKCVDPDLSCQASLDHPSIGSSSHMAGKHRLHRVEEGALPCGDLANQENIDVVNPRILGQLMGLDLILQLVMDLKHG